jgi:hypothetical protein
MNIRDLFSRFFGQTKKTNCPAIHAAGTRCSMTHDAEEIAQRGPKHGGRYRGYDVRWELPNGALIASITNDGRPSPIIVWPEG